MAVDAKQVAMSGPIPGENFTSDTKNYPWHRPPEYTDLDDAIEAAFKKLTEDENSVGLLTMLENGVTVVQATDIFVTAGIGAGKWTPDFALLLAGPVAHIIYLMGKGYGIEVDLGLDAQKKPTTKAFFDGMKRISASRAASAGDKVDLGAIKDTAMEQSLADSGEAPTAPKPNPASAGSTGGFMGMGASGGAEVGSTDAETEEVSL